MHDQCLRANYGRLWTALRIVIGLGVLFVVVRGVRWRELERSWQEIWWLPFGAVIGSRFVMLAARAWRWSVLLRHNSPCPGVGELTRVLLKAELFNNLLPSTAGGDIYRVVATKPTCTTPTATAGVVADRGLGMVVLVVSALLVVVANPWTRQTYVGQAVAPVAVLALGVLVAAWVGRARVDQWLRKRAEADDRGTINAMLRYAWRYYEALESYAHRPRQLAKALLLSIIPVGGLVVSTYLICLRVGATPGIIDLTTVTLTVAVISLLPIFVNGLGGREAAFIIMFQQVGVTASQAALIALLSRAAAVIMAIIAGLLYLYDSSRASAVTSVATPDAVASESKNVTSWRTSISSEVAGRRHTCSR